MDQGATGVAVQMTVLRGENLRGNKNQHFLSFVRAVFNGVVLGDSQKLHVPVDESVNYNFTCSFECSEVAHTLDDLAHKPVILTLIEVFPKEEKQKEEKTSVLGQAVVDLLPLLHEVNTIYNNGIVDAQFIPGISIVDEPVNLDHNDLNSFEDVVFRAEAECYRKRQLEDEIQISFHGVAYVDFAPLLYPGVRHIRGVYRIHPFSESDLLMKEGNVNRAGGEAWIKLVERGRVGERGDERGLAAERGRGVNGRTGRYPWLGLVLREDRKAEISGNIQS
ncbi:hypothetical protein QTP86_007493 [Hemibagrus guttatus]|nr:hypothetical protein QTP86_007493 [Hemibagrus guttatus]